MQLLEVSDAIRHIYIYIYIYIYVIRQLKVKWFKWLVIGTEQQSWKFLHVRVETAEVNPPDA